MGSASADGRILGTGNLRRSMAKSGASSSTREVDLGSCCGHPPPSRSTAVMPSRPPAFGCGWLANGAANNRTRSTCTSAASSSSGRSCRRGGSESVSSRWVRITTYWRRERVTCVPTPQVVRTPSASPLCTIGWRRVCGQLACCKALGIKPSKTKHDTLDIHSRQGAEF